MPEHTDFIAAHDVRPVSFEPDGELGVLVSRCELFRQFVIFFILPLVFLVFLGWKN